MGEGSMWEQFMEDQVEDLQIILLTIGVNGLLQAFEDWLTDNGHLNRIEE